MNESVRPSMDELREETRRARETQHGVSQAYGYPDEQTKAEIDSWWDGYVAGIEFALGEAETT